MFLQYINGHLEKGNEKEFSVYNPANNEIVASLNGVDAAQAETALGAAKEAFKEWSKMPLNKRLVYYDKLLIELNDNKEEIKSLLSQEIGKPWAQTNEEWDVFWGVINDFRDEARHVYGEIMPDYDAAPGEAYFYMHKRPVGVCVAHLAWNFPLLNVGLKLAPAILSGCTVIIKPSSKSPLTALYVGKLCEKAGFPAGVVNIISGSSTMLGKVLNGSTIPRMIGLIGSSETGRQIMAQGATSIKKYSLELGGNAPCIILPDADIEDAVNYIISRKYGTFAGQACGTINRIFVHQSIHDRFITCCKEAIKDWTLGWGDAYKDKKVMGPIIGFAEQKKMQRLVDDAVSKGADVIFGGHIPPDKTKGYYFEPTLLDNVSQDAAVENEEIFGPILPVSAYCELEDVVNRSNATTYGLTSYVFGKDAKSLFYCAENLEFGQVYINGAAKRAHHPHFGVKESGIGVDYGYYSINEYFEWKKIAFKA